MSHPIAPRFNDADLKVIDERRGAITRTEYVKSLVQAALYSIKQKKPDVLRHECGTRYSMFQFSDGEVYLSCPKCHTSRKATKEQIEGLFNGENVRVLPDATPPPTRTA